MNISLTWRIGLRYLRGRRRSGFLSFMVFSSSFGIALGVMVLIVVLSVMNGFDAEIKERLFGMLAPVWVQPADGDSFQDWSPVLKQLKKDPEVQAAAPYVVGQGLLSRHGVVSGVLLQGLDLKSFAGVRRLPDSLQEGQLSDLKPGFFGVILGQALAERLDVHWGEDIMLVLPEATLTPVGVFPRMRLLHVVGIFKMGQGFQFDGQYAFMHLADAQKLLKLGTSVSGLRAELHDWRKATDYAAKLNARLPMHLVAQDWSQTYGSFFHAIEMEKTIMAFVLMLIIAVAAFNLVSSLVMTVQEKESEIAILRTQGMTPSSILKIFVIQGGAIGFLGTFVGGLLGLLLAAHVRECVAWLEALFHVRLFTSQAYYVDYLPSKIILSDVVMVMSTALVLSILATLYPAWRASKIAPAKALRDG